MMKDITEKIAKNFKFIFEKYPALTKLPIYAWGRYYKYECAGSTFELELEESSLDSLARLANDEKYFSKTDRKIFEKIDKDIEDEVFEIDACLPVSREVIAEKYDFDDRGGMCLVLIKNKSGKFTLDAYDCDSPE